MAQQERVVPSGWVPVTVRLKVPAGISSADIFGLAQQSLAALNVIFDVERAPLPVRPRRADRQREEFLAGRSQLVVVRARVDPRDIPRLTGQPYVDHVERAARLEPFARSARTMSHVPAAFRGAHARVDCGGTDRADGDAEDVARDLGVTRMWGAGLTGRGIVVGVVDGGITAHGRPTAIGGWPAIPQPPSTGGVIGGWPTADWGTTAKGWGQHGNMIAFDVQAMAPEAELWDIRIWEPEGAFTDLVANAVEAYRLAIDHFKAHGVPHILVNAWGVYDSDTAPDYAFNPDSHMVRCVEEAIDAGILVLFAAGNCGDGCPFPSGSPCGSGNRGPAASILGPNGHPDVMTVGAATRRGEWCGYTSQGPAALPPNDPDKPDFCALSQFEGFFPNESDLRPYDGGTSAATGIAGGVVALLKQARADLGQEECKRRLRESARPIRARAAHDGAGAGIIDAFAAFRAL